MILVDAGVTLAWKEPLSAIYSSLKQGTASDQLEAAEQELFADPEVVRLARTPDLDRQAKELAGIYKEQIVTGEGFGRIEIPAVGVDYVVVAGTDTTSLQTGPGHYPTTALPGQDRTIGIAGHRTTYGAPFKRIDGIEIGDEITIQMPYGSFTYEVTKTRIVEPSDVQIVDDIGSERLVLTACHPLYSAAQRYAVFAELSDIDPRP